MLWGGYEVGSIIRQHTEGIESVNRALDAFFDRVRDIAGKETVADRALAAADQASPSMPPPCSSAVRRTTPTGAAWYCPNRSGPPRT